MLLLLCEIIVAQALRDPFTPTTLTSTEIHSTLQTILIPIHYADATNIAQFLNNSQNKIISSPGYVAADGRTNQLWIRDQPDSVQRLLHLIKQLDIPVAQVVIKARIVSVDNDFLHSLGVLFGSSQASTTDNANSSPNSLIMDIPATAVSTGSATIPIINFANSHLLDLTLTALEQEGHVELISTPELMTNNRQAAMIESGEEVPYQEKTGQGNTSVAFKKATLRLQVTPSVLPGNRILLQLAVNQDKISSLVVNGVPAIRTQQLSTTVLLKDGETAVLGGIYEEMNQNAETGVPGLRKVPVVGGIFRQRQKLTQRKQLLIFVTPKVITALNQRKKNVKNAKKYE
jgi:type IV pilus assembly protein PilQ